MDLSVYALKSREEVYVWLRQDPDRTIAFYNKVSVLLAELPEGNSLYIPDICKESSFEMFIKMVCLYILECRSYPDFTEYSSFIDFSADFCTIKRIPAFRPSRSLPPLVSKRLGI